MVVLVQIEQFCPAKGNKRFQITALPFHPSGLNRLGYNSLW
jgi:hypothetical protein